MFKQLLPVAALATLLFTYTTMAQSALEKGQAFLAENATKPGVQKTASGLQYIILNPGAYSHTSVAILDALNTFDGPVIEVHISNIHKREAFRHHSFVSSRADGVIAGCGTEGYLLALRRVANLLAKG